MRCCVGLRMSASISSTRRPDCAIAPARLLAKVVLPSPGDGLVTISIAPHPFYKRDGNDIRLDLPVTLKEAVLGGKVKVPTPDGPVMVTIPKGSTSGKVLRLKGRGFTGKNGKRGDQLVALEVDLPPDDAELQSFAEKWSGGGNPRANLGV